MVRELAYGRRENFNALNTSVMCQDWTQANANVEFALI